MTNSILTKLTSERLKAWSLDNSLPPELQQDLEQAGNLIEQQAELLRKPCPSCVDLMKERSATELILKERRETIDKQAMEIEELKQDADIDICRLQLPDGTVSTHTAACARAWHKWANDYWQQLTAAKDELERVRKSLEWAMSQINYTFVKGCPREDFNQFKEAKALLEAR